MDNGGMISPRGVRSGIQLSTYQLQDVTTSDVLEGDMLQRHNGTWVNVPGLMGYRLSTSRSSTTNTETSLLGVAVQVEPNTIYRFRMQLYPYFISSGFYLRLHTATGIGTGGTSFYQVTSTGPGGSIFTTYVNSTAASQITDTVGTSAYRYITIEGQMATTGDATSWNPGMSVSTGGPGISLAAGSWVELFRVTNDANGGVWA